MKTNIKELLEKCSVEELLQISNYIDKLIPQKEHSNMIYDVCEIDHERKRIVVIATYYSEKDLKNPIVQKDYKIKLDIQTKAFEYAKEHNLEILEITRKEYADKNSNEYTGTKLNF